MSARAALNPGYPLAAIADELRTSHGSLDAFTGEPPLADARCVFSWSYRALTPEAARLFRLLALHPGPDCSVAAAASLTATRPRQVRPQLTELVRAHLLFENEPGRFSSHSLLRAYAAELVDELDTPGDITATTTRVLDHYLHSAHAAETVLAPHRERITLRRPAVHTLPERFPDQRTAADWFDRERPVLLTAVEQDSRRGDGIFSWQLAAVLELYLDRNGRWQQQRTVQTTAITAAQRGGNLLGQAHGHRALGFALSLARTVGGCGRTPPACTAVVRRTRRRPWTGPRPPLRGVCRQSARPTRRRTGPLPAGPGVLSLGRTPQRRSQCAQRGGLDVSADG
ncbi:hypothetical protein ACFQ51_54760 [Streptomyces kaempferi]